MGQPTEAATAGFQQKKVKTCKAEVQGNKKYRMKNWPDPNLTKKWAHKIKHSDETTIFL